MPIGNLSKIFGPTVIGYSSAEPDYHTIFSETMIQKDVRRRLDRSRLILSQNIVLETNI